MFAFIKLESICRVFFSLHHSSLKYMIAKYIFPNRCYRGYHCCMHCRGGGCHKVNCLLRPAKFTTKVEIFMKFTSAIHTFAFCKYLYH